MTFCCFRYFINYLFSFLCSKNLYVCFSMGCI